MRYRKAIALTLFIFMSSVLFIGFFSIAVNTTPEPSLPDAEPIDIGHKLRTSDYGIEGSVGEGLKTSALPKSAAFVEGDIAMWLTLDDYMGYYFFTEFELRAVGTYAEIWVQIPVEREFLPGDPRNDPLYQDGDGRYHFPEVTDAQVAYLLDEFDNNIYPKDTTYFGEPDFHDGSLSLLEAWGYVPPGYYYEENGKTAILVANVRDYAYYDPSYPYYIAGFFSSSLEGYFDRNVISIDTHQWYRRIGDEGMTWESELLGITYPPVDRPNLYEGTIAHEYQHLIHNDYNPDDDLWMNEACSMFAEPLCEYPIDYGSVIRYLHSPDNSLTLWGDQGDINILADYGAVFLWAMYLNDHYGGAAFLSQFVQAGIPGVAGIEAALEFLGYEEDFMDIYHDWRIANLIQADDGRYSYNTMDLDPITNPDLSGTGLTVHEVTGATIPWTSGATAFGNTFSWDGDDTGISELGSFGTDYIHFPDLSGLNFVFFDGDDTALVPGWELNEGMWYSGAKDLTNSLIFGAAHVDGADPMLTMTTYWDIEDYWDFGFVQVSTDNGDTWTSLENAYTTYDYDPNAHPDVIANLPGLTGWSIDFIDISFDLTAYADQDVLIGLRYVTDWATVYEGWYVEDNVQVSGTKVDFESLFPEADFMVSVVEKTTYCGGMVRYRVRNIRLMDASEFGATVAFGSCRTEVWLIVSPVMEVGFGDYKFKTWRPRRCRCW